MNLANIIKINKETLVKQSRSFSIPILNLDNHLMIPVMVEYNLNKTVDTIEDNLILSPLEKETLIQLFCDALKSGTISNIVKYTMLSLTPKNEQFVYKNYQATLDLFNQLSNIEKNLSIKYTIEMARGMVFFSNKAIESLEDLNHYCYYVAGTVGLYLTELMHHFYPLNPAHCELAKKYSIGFGLFLQKLNVIRDYTEDCSKNQGSYWPKSLLKKYKDKKEILNHLCLKALSEDAHQALEYYKLLQSLNVSFDGFMRFILYSGLRYISLLKNNNKVFTNIKVKLPKTFINSLYKKINHLSASDFSLQCEQLIQQEVNYLKQLVKTPL